MRSKHAAGVYLEDEKVGRRCLAMRERGGSRRETEAGREGGTWLSRSRPAGDGGITAPLGFSPEIRGGVLSRYVIPAVRAECDQERDDLI